MVYTPTSPNTVYRLLIVLDGIDPPIWRILDIQATLSLSSLHDALQWVMGWENEHRYFFYRGEFSYVENPVVHEWSVGKELDATNHSLKKVFGHRGRYLEYIYDMSDNWRHHIWLEDYFVARPRLAYPRLCDGAGACPPEGFGGPKHYQKLLSGELDAPTLEKFNLEIFNPGDFDPSPRSFPEAQILIFDEDAVPDNPLRFDAQAAEMLGELTEDVEALLNSVNEDFRQDLCHSLEDLVLTEDSLPPLITDILEEARQEKIGVEDFLLELILHHKELSDSYSYAPLHAARVISQWPVPEAPEVFVRVLKETGDDSEGTIDTMIDVLMHTSSGTERLLDTLEELPDDRRLRALDVLVQQGEQDERIFAHLKAAMADASPSHPTAPFILSYYNDPRAIDLLQAAFHEALQKLKGDLSEVSDDDLLERSDYALFLSEMVVQAGGEIPDNDRRILDELEDFFWSAEQDPGYARPP